MQMTAANVKCFVVRLREGTVLACRKTAVRTPILSREMHASRLAVCVSEFQQCNFARFREDGTIDPTIEN